MAPIRPQLPFGHGEIRDEMGLFVFIYLMFHSTHFINVIFLLKILLKDGKNSDLLIAIDLRSTARQPGV